MANGVKKENTKELMLSENPLLLTVPDKCSNCRSEYTYVGLGKYECEKCGDIFLNEYGKVREFVDTHGTAYNIREISEITGVSKRYIDIFIREGKFDKVNRVRRCNRCGDIILTGEYCEHCLVRRIKEEAAKDKVRIINTAVFEDEEAEMRYLGKRDKE